MATTPYAFYPHSTSFALSSLLLFYMLFHECYWLATMSECQIEKMNKSEKSIFLQIQQLLRRQTESSITFTGHC